MPIVQAFRDPELSEKVASLRLPDAWPERPRTVEAIETHFAWVFLSERFVYKLKKPVRFPDFDLTTPQARRAMCELEIALNRRLAAATYIGVVPLGRDGAKLRLECGHGPVDWLVKMHRLPAATTLEHLLPSLDRDDPRLTQLMSVLCEFYGRTARASWTAREYLDSLEQAGGEASRLLRVAELAAEHRRIRRIAELHSRFAAGHGSALERRIVDGRVRDVHGDLRPEHIFLTATPQIIDCLEFSAMLRQLDAAEEISFLALECARLRRPDIGETLVGLYRRSCGDAVPGSLLAFYRSRRALVRAFLCAWHLEDGLREAVAAHWLAQAHWYIGEAESCIEHALETSSTIPA